MISSGTALPIARYRVAFRLRDGLRLPDYAGSLLRGQFGAALRRSACMTREKSCPACPLYRTCPYPAIFETPPPETHALQKFSQVPNPYVIEPATAARTLHEGDELAFGMVLVGDALRQLPLITHAWQCAFAHGIGQVRARGDLVDIQCLPPDQAPRSIWDHNAARLASHQASIAIPPFPATDRVTLHFTTPLRLQHQGRALREEELTARTLVAQLVRRISLLLELHAGITPAGVEAALVRSAESLTDRRALRYRDWTRYSSRQQQEMNLGGHVGSWTLFGDLTPLMPWLWLGQWLHAGKNATFGLGAYTLAGHKSAESPTSWEPQAQATEKHEESEVPQ